MTVTVNIVLLWVIFLELSLIDDYGGLKLHNYVTFSESLIFPYISVHKY